MQLKSRVVEKGSVGLLVTGLTLLVGCGGGSSPEDEVAGVAKDHLVAITEFNGAGACGPMGAEAVEEFALAGDEDEGWETATESAYCRHVFDTRREEFADVDDGPQKEDAVKLLDALKTVEMQPADINPDGISATVITQPFTIELLGEEGTAQVRYSMVKENGQWLVNEAEILDEGEDPEEGSRIFPDV